MLPLSSSHPSPRAHVLVLFCPRSTVRYRDTQARVTMDTGEASRFASWAPFGVSHIDAVRTCFDTPSLSLSAPLSPPPWSWTQGGRSAGVGSGLLLRAAEHKDS